MNTPLDAARTLAALAAKGPLTELDAARALADAARERTSRVVPVQPRVAA